MRDAWGNRPGWRVHHAGGGIPLSCRSLRWGCRMFGKSDEVWWSLPKSDEAWWNIVEHGPWSIVRVLVEAKTMEMWILMALHRKSLARLGFHQSPKMSIFPFFLLNKLFRGDPRLQCVVSQLSSDQNPGWLVIAGNTKLYIYIYIFIWDFIVVRMINPSWETPSTINQPVLSHQPVKKHWRFGFPSRSHCRISQHPGILRVRQHRRPVGDGGPAGSSAGIPTVWTHPCCMMLSIFDIIWWLLYTFIVDDIVIIVDPDIATLEGLGRIELGLLEGKQRAKPRKRRNTSSMSLVFPRGMDHGPHPGKASNHGHLDIRSPTYSNLVLSAIQGRWMVDSWLDLTSGHKRTNQHPDEWLRQPLRCKLGQGGSMLWWNHQLLYFWSRKFEIPSGSEWRPNVVFSPQLRAKPFVLSIPWRKPC